MFTLEQIKQAMREVSEEIIDQSCESVKDAPVGSLGKVAFLTQTVSILAGYEAMLETKLEEMEKEGSDE